MNTSCCLMLPLGCAHASHSKIALYELSSGQTPTIHLGITETPPVQSQDRKYFYVRLYFPSSCLTVAIIICNFWFVLVNIIIDNILP